MRIYTFGDKTKEKFLLLPGKFIEGNVYYEEIIPWLTQTFYVISVSYSGFDGKEDRIFKSFEFEADILEKYIREAILASTTSSIDAEKLATWAKYPERLLVAHPFQPAHLLPLVELVSHSRTEADALESVSEVLEKKLHRQVVSLKRSVPGFLVNRLAQTLFRESIYLIEEGVTTASDIDLAVKYAVGLRYGSIGLLEYYDAVGFQLEKTIAENVYPDLCDAKEPQRTTLEGIEKGKTGQETGEGFFDWSLKDAEDFHYRKQTPFFDGVREWDMPVKILAET